MKKVREFCFSPTGGTRSILDAIASGLGKAEIVSTDFTTPDNRRDWNLAVQEDLVLVGVPVYAERVPGIVRLFLAQVKGNGRPAAIVWFMVMFAMSGPCGYYRTYVCNEALG